jgi:hypothetical protein
MVAFDDDAAGGVLLCGIAVASPPREPSKAATLLSIFLSYSAKTRSSSAASRAWCRDKCAYKPAALQVAPDSQRALITGTLYTET